MFFLKNMQSHSGVTVWDDNEAEEEAALPLDELLHPFQLFEQ